MLRQSGDHRFIVRSSAVVREIATAQPAFAPFAKAPHRWSSVPFDTPLERADADDLVGTALTVEAFALPGTTPGFDGRRRVEGAVVGFRIAARGSSTTPPSLHRSTQRSPIACATRSRLRASRFSTAASSATARWRRRDLGDKPATALGHLPAGGEHGTLAVLRGVGERRILAHVNNSNPRARRTLS